MAINQLRRNSVFGSFGMPQEDIMQEPGSYDYFATAPVEYENQNAAPPSEYDYEADMNTRQVQVPERTAMPDTQVRGLDRPKGPTPNYIELMNAQFTPETEATQRFNDYLNSFPEREKPSIARRLVASGSALRGGLDSAQKIMNEPYVRDVAAWKEQGQPLYNAANLERQSNINERQLVGQMAQYQVQSDKNEAANEVARTRAETDRNYRNAQIFKMNNPDYEFYDDGTTIMAKDPATGKVYSTGVESGKLGEMEKLNLLHKQRIEQIKETGAQAQATKATVPGVNPADPRLPENKPLTKTEFEHERQKLFRSIIELGTPEYSKHIIKNNDGTYALGPAPTIGSWMQSDTADIQDMLTYDEVRKLLYPGYKGDPKLEQYRKQQQAPPSQQQPPGANGRGLAPRTVPTEPNVYNTPASKAPASGVYAPQKGKAEGVYAPQTVEPGGAWAKTPPPPQASQPGQMIPGQTWMRNVETGEVGLMPSGNVEAAVASKRFQRVQ